MHSDFWDGQAGGTEISYSQQVLSQEQTQASDPQCAVKQPLRVLADFDLCGEHLRKADQYLLRWARLRKGSVQLCCRELKIGASHVSTVLEILSILDRDRVQELERNSWWQWGIQAWLAHFLRQLGNFLGISKTVFSGDSAPPDVKSCVTEPVPQFSNPDGLQRLYMNSIYCLKGNLKALLR